MHRFPSAVPHLYEVKLLNCELDFGTCACKIPFFLGLELLCRVIMYCNNSTWQAGRLELHLFFFVKYLES